MSWKNKPFSHKVATFVAVLVVLVWLVSLVKTDLFPIDVTYPAIAVFTLCEAVIYWEKKRKWAGLLIVGAILCMVCFVLELMLL